MAWLPKWSMQRPLAALQAAGKWQLSRLECFPANGAAGCTLSLHHGLGVSERLKVEPGHGLHSSSLFASDAKFQLYRRCGTQRVSNIQSHSANCDPKSRSWCSSEMP